MPKLLKRFSSGEGYAAFEDAIPTSELNLTSTIGEKLTSPEPLVRHLHDELGVATAVVSNGDSRLRK